MFLVLCIVDYLMYDSCLKYNWIAIHHILVVVINNLNYYDECLLPINIRLLKILIINEYYLSLSITITNTNNNLM